MHSSTTTTLPVAFQGIPGAFSEEALIAHFGDETDRTALRTFEAVFEAVADGSASAGVVPIENSLAGSVLENHDLLLAHAVTVIGEAVVAVRHHLLAPPGVELADVTTARSHPQALAQCAVFLDTHSIEPIAATNTAVAARDVAAAGAGSEAALASARAGELHGLQVLVRDAQTRSDNTTRFFVIARERPPALAANKASLAFVTRNEPGALLGCLEVFAAAYLNLTRLESRPTGDTLWEYTFYADLEAQGRGELDAATVSGVLDALAPRATDIRLLGRYPRA
jgi:prephenate dehydratase